MSQSTLITVYMSVRPSQYNFNPWRRTKKKLNCLLRAWLTFNTFPLTFEWNCNDKSLWISLPLARALTSRCDGSDGWIHQKFRHCVLRGREAATTTNNSQFGRGPLDICTHKIKLMQLKCHNKTINENNIWLNKTIHDIIKNHKWIRDEDSTAEMKGERNGNLWCTRIDWIGWVELSLAHTTLGPNHRIASMPPKSIRRRTKTTKKISLLIIVHVVLMARSSSFN